MSDDNKDRERARKAATYKKNRELLLIKAAIYRANNKDKIRESQKAWVLKNKETLKKKHREYHAANKEKKNKQSKLHRLANVEKYEARFAQYREKHREKLRNQAREYYHNNKQKRAAYAAEYRKANKEKIQAYWRSPKGKTVMMNAMHRRRSRISKTSTVTSSEMLALKRKAKSCYYCGIKTNALTFDHIQPLTKGGAHTLDNLIMACAPCNSRKHAKDPHIFARQIGLLLI
jgi:5-methylcytosine-specific restriction endonuclease McrA